MQPPPRCSLPLARSSCSTAASATCMMRSCRKDNDEEFLPLEIRDDDEDGDFMVADIPSPPPRRSCYVPSRRSVAGPPSHMGTPQRRNSLDVPRRLWKEEETVKTLQPTVWLTEDFPLSIDEFLPLLDILATHVRVVRHLYGLLTTKFPPGRSQSRLPFEENCKN